VNYKSDKNKEKEIRGNT